MVFLPTYYIPSYSAGNSDCINIHYRMSQIVHKVFLSLKFFEEPRKNGKLKNEEYFIIIFSIISNFFFVFRKKLVLGIPFLLDTLYKNQTIY